MHRRHRLPACDPPARLSGGGAASLGFQRAVSVLRRLGLARGTRSGHRVLPRLRDPAAAYTAKKLARVN
jgi:hypothetical protein